MIRLFRYTPLVSRLPIGRMLYSTVPPPPPPLDAESDRTQNARNSIKDAMLCAQDKMGRCNCWKEGGYCGAEEHATQRRLKTSLQKPQDAYQVVECKSTSDPEKAEKMTIKAKLTGPELDRLVQLLNQHNFRTKIEYDDKRYGHVYDVVVSLIGTLLGGGLVLLYSNWQHSKKNRK